MCCHLVVTPFNRELAVVVLTIGQFTARDGNANVWVRNIPEEGTNVTATFMTDALDLSLGPSVSTYAHHAMKRRAAGIYFEIATRYAEKVGGRIEQRSNVDRCIENSDHNKVLAHYPGLPMSFDRVCVGFREAILGETGGG